MAVVIIFMFYTGLCLWAPTADWAICAAFTNLINGAMSMRILHYFLMFVFVAFMFLHAYLALIEGTAPAKLMFFRKEHGGFTYDPDKHVIIGEDKLEQE